MRYQKQTVVLNLFGRVGDHEKGFTSDLLVGRLAPFLQGDDERRESFDLLFVINSQGGSTEESLRIYSYLASLPVPITTIGVGLVESAAVTVFLAGTKRLATPTTTFLIHEGVTSFKRVSSSRLMQVAKACIARDKSMMRIIANATGNKKQAAKWVRGEHPFTLEEAKKVGIVHEVIDKLFSGDAVYA